MKGQNMNKDDYKKLKDKLCSHDSRYDEKKLIEKLMREKIQLMCETTSKKGRKNDRKCSSSRSSESLW